MTDSNQQKKGGFGAFAKREDEDARARNASPTDAPKVVPGVPRVNAPFSVTKEASSTLGVPVAANADKTTDAPPSLRLL